MQLENGQYALYPNNRTRIYDLSITPEEPLTPDFKVSTQYYQVEQGVRWGRLGDTDEYFWQTKEESNGGEIISLHWCGELEGKSPQM